MTINKEDIVKAVAEMNVIEICDLVKIMEEKFNISAQTNNTSQNNNDVVKEEKPEEKTEFNVVLIKAGSNKISAIKAVRSVTSLSLKDAKAAVEGVPFTIKESISKEEAQEIKNKVEESGAKVELQ